MVPGLEGLRNRGVAALADMLPGLAADVASYRVIERRPLETTFSGMRVATCPAPSLGGAVVVAGLAALALRRPKRRPARPGARRRAPSAGTGALRRSRR